MKLKLLLVSFLLIAYVKVSAQWEQLPDLQNYGGDVSCIAVNGNIVFAGTLYDGLFISTDTGDTWLACKTGIMAKYYSLIFYGQTIFAGTDTMGIIKSSDGGKTWTTANTGMLNPNASTITALTVIGDTLFAGVKGTGGGVYVSVDNGGHWKLANIGIPGIEGLSFAVNGTTIYMGTSSDGVFRSDDFGTNWSPTDLGSGEVRAMTVFKNNIYAGVYGEGVYRTLNGGASWTLVDVGLNDYNILSMTATSTYIFAGSESDGLYRSSNGSGWSYYLTGLTAYDVPCLAIGGTKILAGSSEGLYATAYSPASKFTRVGVPDLSEYEIFSLLSTDTSLYAGTEYAAFISVNHGDYWKELVNGLEDQYVYSLSKNGTYLYAGTGNGLYSSTNNGASWTVTDETFTDVIISLYVNGAKIFAGTNANGIYYSTDRGKSWNPIDGDLDPSISVYSIVPLGTAIYIGTDQGIYVTTNNGTIWTAAGLNTNHVNSIAFKGSYMIAAANDGIYVSENYGADWTQTFPDVYGQAILISGNYIFAGANGDGVFLSTDNGLDWLDINDGLFDSNILSLTVDSNYIYAGSDGDGVWRRLISDITTGIGGYNKNYSSLRIYPNPMVNSSVLHFSKELKNAEVIIYDMQSKEIMKNHISGNKLIINNEVLGKGLYLIRIVEGNNQYTQKLIVE